MKLLLTSITLLLISFNNYSNNTDRVYISEKFDTIGKIIYSIPDIYSLNISLCYRYDYRVYVANADSFTMQILDTNEQVVFWSNNLDSGWNPYFENLIQTPITYTCQLTLWTGLKDSDRFRIDEKMYMVRQKFIILG